jgi:hypothetical protein
MQDDKPSTQTTRSRLRREETIALSHGDLCRLSRAFLRGVGLWTSQDQRINEWLKASLARTAEREGVQ